MKKRFSKKVGSTRAEKVIFLTEHERYDDKFAADVRVQTLDIPKELIDRAYEYTQKEEEVSFFSSVIRSISDNVFGDMPYTVQLCGGYLVLHKAYKYKGAYGKEVIVLDDEMGSEDPEYYENVRSRQLIEETIAVQRFDKVCDLARTAFIEFLYYAQIEGIEFVKTEHIA